MAFDRNTIESLIAPVVEAMGYKIWYVELHGSKRRTLLRIYVDLPPGDERRSVSIDDCALISKQIGALLDVEGCIPGDYVLEVSSPGVDRSLFKLEHYKKYIDNLVRIVLREPENGQSNFTGRILDVDDDKLKLEVDDKNINFELSGICKAKLIEGEKR